MAESKPNRKPGDVSPEVERERSIPTALKEKADRVVRIFKGMGSDEEREYLFDQLADLACFNCGHIFEDDDDADEHEDECPGVEDEDDDADDDEDDSDPPPAEENKTE